MTTLVTGATGFIGGNLARALWRRGDEVRALTRPGANDLAIRDTDVQQVPGDLLDRASLDRAVSGCAAVYHCAATYAFWSRNPRDIYRANVDGTRNVIDAARNAGVRRLVYTSSVATIGLPHQDPGRPDRASHWGSEDTTVNPDHLVGHYKRSKYQAERAALAANSGNFSVVVVNPCAPIGEWDVKPTPTGRIPLDFARGRTPGYVSAGMNVIDAADVAAGHILAMERGRPGQRYILGNRNLTLQQIFAILAEITGRSAPRLRFPWWLITAAAHADQFLEGNLLRRPPTIPVEAIRVSRRPMYVSSQKAVAELGLPQTPVAEALEKAVRWFSDYGYLTGRRPH